MTITINGTTGIAGVDGSASVPAFQGNDPDTGIFYPAANTVAAAAGGATVWNASSTFGFKNRIINGSMAIDQRNNGGVVTVSTANVIYSVDRFYLYALGAAITAQRVSSGRTDFPFALRATGASSNTYCEIGQRIEAANCTDLVGSTITVSFFAARSSGTSLLVRLSYANSSDNFSSITSIASQSVTIGSTLAQYTVTFSSLPAQAANGLQIGLEFGALGSGQTASATGVQLEAGPVATSFDFRPYGTEFGLCLRYYEELITPHGVVCSAYNTSDAYANISYSAKRTAPTLALTPNGNFYSANAPRTVSSVSGQNVTVNSFQFKVVASGLTPGYAGHYDFSSANVRLSAEL